MARIVSAYASYVWDENKRIANLDKHGIDFEDAVLALEEPHVEFLSERSGETRKMAICPEAGRLIVIIFKSAGDECRIISARMAHRNERRKFHESFGK